MTWFDFGIGHLDCHSSNGYLRNTLHLNGMRMYFPQKKIFTLGSVWFVEHTSVLVDKTPGLYSLKRHRLIGIGILIIVNLRRSSDHLRFMMGISILARQHRYTETGSRLMTGKQVHRQACLILWAPAFTIGRGFPCINSLSRYEPDYINPWVRTYRQVSNIRRTLVGN